MDRRKVIAALGIAGMVVPMLTSAARNALEPILPTDKHIFNTQGSKFVFIGSDHLQDPKVNIEEPLDALFLETGMEGYLKQGSTEYQDPHVERTYQWISPKIRSENIPILYGDIPFRNILTGYGNIAIATGVSVGAAAFSADQIAVPRRSFFKRGATALLGLWGYGKLGNTLFAAIPEILRSNRLKYARDLGIAAEIAHPEDLSLLFRNAVIADKLLFYAQQLKQQGIEEPTIALAMGEGHELISEYLKHGKKFCLEIIDNYPEPLLTAFFGDNYSDYLPTLYEVRKEGNATNAKMFQDPDLLRITGKEQEITTGSSEILG